MISQFDKKESVVSYHLNKLERKVERMSRKAQLSDREKIAIGNNLEFIQSVRELVRGYRTQLDIGLGKLPPQATDLEEAVLGALILEFTRQHKAVMSFLSPGHFYSEKHKQIFTSIANLHKSNLQVDMLTVIADLRKRGVIEMVGGAHYISHITSKVSSAANLEYHSRILVEYAIKRELILLAGELLNDAYRDEVDCFELIEKTKHKLLLIEQENVRK